MSTLQEIEAAVEALPAPQQQELLVFLIQRVKGINGSDAVPAEDPFAALIGAFAGPHEPTGRRAEELLYGRGA